MSECFFECPTADRGREKERVVISGMGVRGGSPFVVVVGVVGGADSFGLIGERFGRKPDDDISRRVEPREILRVPMARIGCVNNPFARMMALLSVYVQSYVEAKNQPPTSLRHLLPSAYVFFLLAVLALFASEERGQVPLLVFFLSV